MRVAYVAHQYWAPTALQRISNVESAASLATAVLRSGRAAIAPLQLARGIENELDEQEWLERGLALVERCDEIVVPRSHIEHNRGVRQELALAMASGLTVHYANLRDDEWVVDWAGETMPCPPPGAAE